MIKNLLNADEEPPPGTKVVVEETIIEPPSVEPSVSEPAAAVEETSEKIETRQVFEIPEDARFFAKPGGENDEILQIPEAPPPTVAPVVETKENESVNLESSAGEIENAPVAGQFIDEKTNDEKSAPTIFQSAYQSETPAETVRQSGLAYSAAIVFFGSVVFMLVFGWFADQLLGSSPWGIVVGIVLGGVIGFVQFFRITSQIFKK